MAPRGGSKSATAGTAADRFATGSGGAGDSAAAAEARFPLFYRSLTPLDAARHAGKSLKERIGFEFARSSHAVLLNGSEFEAAARYYPIVFTPSPAAAALSVVGVRRDHNLFVDAAGDWRPSTYIPAYIRRYPFIFHESADKQQYTLCIDETSGAIEDGGNRPLFSGGKPTPLVQDAPELRRAAERARAPDPEPGGHHPQFRREARGHGLPRHRPRPLRGPAGQRLPGMAAKGLAALGVRAFHLVGKLDRAGRSRRRYREGCLSSAGG